MDDDDFSIEGNSSKDDTYVHGHLKWLTQDPGRQLLTGKRLTFVTNRTMVTFERKKEKQANSRKHKQMRQCFFRNRQLSSSSI
jgi:hypothetical protein